VILLEGEDLSKANHFAEKDDLDKRWGMPA
jgi:hypothetical protein